MMTQEPDTANMRRTNGLFLLTPGHAVDTNLWHWDLVVCGITRATCQLIAIQTLDNSGSNADVKWQRGLASLNFTFTVKSFTTFFLA